MPAPRASAPRVGFVHALRDSMAAVDAALAEHWPEATALHLFDGSLYLDRSRGSVGPEEIARRVAALLRHSAGTGAEAILFTGSFFGDAVEAGRAGLGCPVLTSFDALVEAAFTIGRRFQVVSTARDSAPLLIAELERYARVNGIPVDADGMSLPDALDALLAGDGERHDEAIAAAVGRLPDCDAVLFAQFSMGRAKAAAARSGRRILAPAETGVQKLRSLLRRD